MPKSKVSQFTGEYRWLSNFWNATIYYDGVHYPSVEHAYQAAKSPNITIRRHVAALSKPGDAKRYGRKIPLRDDWEDVKADVMLDLLRLKFSYTDLREKLLNTGDAELVEGNYWNDTYWGVCRGKGENVLGKLLMRVREECRL